MTTKNVHIDPLGYASARQKQGETSDKKYERRKTRQTKPKQSGDRTMNKEQTNAHANPVPPAGGQTADQVNREVWKGRARSFGSVAYEGGKTHILAPVVHGFFYAVGAGLAFKGGKKLGLI